MSTLNNETSSLNTTQTTTISSSPVNNNISTTVANSLIESNTGICDSTLKKSGNLVASSDTILPMSLCKNSINICDPVRAKFSQPIKLDTLENTLFCTTKKFNDTIIGYLYDTKGSHLSVSLDICPTAHTLRSLIPKNTVSAWIVDDSSLNAPTLYVTKSCTLTEACKTINSILPSFIQDVCSSTSKCTKPDFVTAITSSTFPECIKVQEVNHAANNHVNQLLTPLAIGTAIYFIYDSNLSVQDCIKEIFGCLQVTIASAKSYFKSDKVQEMK